MKRQWKSTEHELAKTVKSQADMYERTVEQRNMLQEQLSRSNERRRAAGKRMQALQRKIQELKEGRDLLIALCAKLKGELGHPLDLEETISELREKTAALDAALGNGVEAYYAEQEKKDNGKHTEDEVAAALLHAIQRSAVPLTECPELRDGASPVYMGPYDDAPDTNPEPTEKASARGAQRKRTQGTPLVTRSLEGHESRQAKA